MSRITFDNTYVDDEIIENDDGTYNFLFATTDDIYEYLFNNSSDVQKDWKSFRDLIDSDNYIDFYVDYDDTKKRVVNTFIIVDGIEYPVNVDASDKSVLADICEEALEQDSWDRFEGGYDDYGYYDEPSSYEDRNYMRLYHDED